MFQRRSLGLAAASLLAACSSTGHVPAPLSSDLGGIAIRVKVRAPIRMFSQRPSQVLFIRLSGPGGSPVDGEFMPSNCEEDGYVMLLNAPPGNYVAVSCFKEMEPVPTAPEPSSSSVTIASHRSLSISVAVPTFRPGPTNYTTYFPEDMIRETEVSVPSGGIAFMGDYVVDQSVGLKGCDTIQRHFYSQFGGGDENESFLGNAFGGDYHYRGELHESARDEATRASFREDCNSFLIEAGWPPLPER